MVEGCPSREALAAHLAGSSTAQARAACDAHLATCTTCSMIARAPFVGDGDGELATPTLEPAANVALSRGALLGRYIVLESFGGGGLGEVYAAYDPGLDRRVAIKLLRSLGHDGERGEEVRARLVHEAKALARVSHPNVVQVYDVGMVDTQVFIAMELVAGLTLRQWLKTKRPGWREIVDVMTAVAAGVQSVHDAGLVHRDLKPGNIMVDGRGRALLLDFGIARAIAVDEMPGATSVAGTPGYMAPEQYEGGAAIDARSDQFAFCATLHEALYHKRPFAGTEVETLMAAARTKDIIPCPAVREVPARLRDVILRGLEPHPADRYASMRELVADLNRDRVARTRQRAGIVASAILSGVLVWTLSSLRTPDDDALAEIDRIVVDARGAAARSYFVYPPSDQPGALAAYGFVLQLDAIDGPATDEARRHAAALRHEFAATLLRLGDEYWERDGGAPFAVDYYAASLVFEDDARARERTSFTPVQLERFRAQAASGEFSAAELAAGETLVALAAPDDDARVARLRVLGEKSSPISASAAAGIDALLGERAPRIARATKSSRAPSPARDEPAVAVGIDGPSVVATAARPAASNAAVPARRSAASPAPAESGVIDRDLAKRETAAGNAAFRSGKLEAAETAYHRALEADPRSAAALAGLTELHFERGAYLEAAKVGANAVRIAPRNAKLRILLGDAYFKLLRHGDARGQYERAAVLSEPRASDRLARLDKLMGK